MAENIDAVTRGEQYMVHAASVPVIKRDGQAITCGNGGHDRSIGFHAQTFDARLQPRCAGGPDGTGGYGALQPQWNALKPGWSGNDLVQPRRTDVRGWKKQIAPDRVMQQGSPMKPMNTRRPDHKFNVGTKLVQQGSRFEGALAAADDNQLFPRETTEVAVIGGMRR